MGKQIFRADWHDYRSRCIYMVTINKAPEVKDFGTLVGDVNIPRGERNSPFVSTSYVGAAIKFVLRRFSEIEPAARILQYAIMPDHIHLLIFIESATEDTLGMILARFKVEVNKRLGMTHVFDKGFNDQILGTGRKLDVLFNYLRDNPRRLAERRANPEFFRRLNNLEIGGRAYQAYGNIQLLDNPFKTQVVVHRADTSQQRGSNRRRLLYTATNGVVLVSPFISSAEKEIRNEAEFLEARIILITAEPFGERYKPAAHNFSLCEAGRLLIISAASVLGVTAKTEFTRAHCLYMNSLAQSICALPK